jgi:hypothetical protein
MNNLYLMSLRHSRSLMHDDMRSDLSDAHLLHMLLLSLDMFLNSFLMNLMEILTMFDGVFGYVQLVLSIIQMFL